jgi:hypothetical protein
MFAMRACRKSVMVGMPLAKNQMRSVSRDYYMHAHILPFTQSQLFEGCATYGYHGSAMELPAWKTYDASSL